jgi:hypothetical protein
MDGFVVRDTHKLIAKLQQRGFSAQQAEGITEAIKEIDAADLATKADVQQLKIDFEKVLHRQTWGLVGVIFAHGAFIIAVLQLLQ